MEKKHNLSSLTLIKTRPFPCHLILCGYSNSDPEILTYVAGANSLKQSNDPVASNVYPLPQMYAVAQCARQARTIQKTTKLRWPCLKCNQLYQHAPEEPGWTNSILPVFVHICLST